MKQVVLTGIGTLLTVVALGQRVGTDEGLPSLPLRFSNARRYQPAYVDSVVGATRSQLRRLERLPRSPHRDTLRLELMLYLTYCYQFATNGLDSVHPTAQRLVRLAGQWGKTRYQVAGYIEESEYHYNVRKNYPEALRASYGALRLVERDPVVANTYLWRVQRSLGQLSFRMGKCLEANAFYRAAYASLTRDLHALRTERMDLLQLMSENFQANDQLDSAENSLKLALFLAFPLQKSIYTKGYLHNDLGVVYLRQRRYDEAIAEFVQAEERWQRANFRTALAMTWAHMAHVYYLTQQPDKALDYAQRALDYADGTSSTRLLSYEVLALASAAKRDWEPAFTYHQRFKALADSVQRQGKLAETMTLQADYAREKLLLRQQQEAQRYQSLQQEKALQEQQYLTLAREAELRNLRATTEQQRLAQLARQSEWQRRLETEALRAQAQARQNQQRGQIKTLQLSRLEDQIRLQTQSRNFGLMLALLLGLSLLGYTQLLRRKNQALHQKNTELEAAQWYGQTQEMAALRAQMNPHFIFNCINSIKLYTLENDTDRASDYLTKFARLIRLVLENSRSERVTLQNELDMLRLYLEMEAMRFKQKLRFQITNTPGLELAFIEMPPLLIQPYVENAIWHGLMHKTDGGTVTVAVSQPADHQLAVTITDDGVGRARAAELKSKSANARRSFGMKVTSDRIALINQLYKTQTAVVIHDLVTPDGQAAGTEVTLTIPI